MLLIHKKERKKKIQRIKRIRKYFRLLHNYINNEDYKEEDAINIKEKVELIEHHANMDKTEFMTYSSNE